MEGGEINKFIKVWFTVFVSLCYCYTISKNVPKGITRLLTILPIVCLFLILPLNLASAHLGSLTGFLIAWLTNFKLLLFAFNKGPLSSDPSISLPRFVAIACLPIKIQQQQQQQQQHHPSHKIDPKVVPQMNGDDPCPKTTPPKGLNSPINYAIKLLFLVMLLRLYDHSDYLHPTFILIVNCFHVYFLLEIILAMVAAMARLIFGLELESQFDDPHLSTSLQDFWGRRWNLMVTRILRPTVYEPVLHFSIGPMGQKWAQLLGVLSTFFVSGMMHELVFYYLNRVRPTWEVTCFFLLHGLCLMVEIAAKKKFKGKFHLPRFISGCLTIGFVMCTGYWLFFPQLLRSKPIERAAEEYAAVGAFVKHVGRALRPWFTF